MAWPEPHKVACLIALEHKDPAHEFLGQETTQPTNFDMNKNNTSFTASVFEVLGKHNNKALRNT
jgi:hypothetical protein